MQDPRTIAIAAQDDCGLDGRLGAHFARCPYFVVVNVLPGAARRARVVRNPYFAQHQPGAVPSFVQGLGAEVVLSGTAPPLAVELFRGRGIVLSSSASRTVEAALDGYLRGSPGGARTTPSKDRPAKPGHRRPDAPGCG